MAKPKELDSRKQKARIVMVENDDNDAFFIERALRRAGFSSPTRLGDGQCAIEYFTGLPDDEHPDAVLLDLKMPRKDGFEVLQWLRGRSQSLPVIILSSSDEPRDIRRAERLHATKFLCKKHPFRDVIEILEELLRT